MSADWFPDWRVEAACRSTPDVVHTTKREVADDVIFVFCRPCPVRDECRKDVMDWPPAWRNSGLVAGGRFWPRSGDDEKQPSTEGAQAA